LETKLLETAQPCESRATVDQRERFRVPAGFGLAAGRAGCFGMLLGRVAGACVRFGCTAGAAAAGV
jgi:hypothetical protein